MLGRKEWVLFRLLSTTLVEIGRRWLCPDLAIGVRLYDEQALVADELALSEKMANGVQEVSIVNCVVLFTVDFEQIVPNVASEGAAIVGKHARRLRNELQVDGSLGQEHFVLLLLVGFAAILRNLTILAH